jgi:hypothetical protein
VCNLHFMKDGSTFGLKKELKYLGNIAGAVDGIGA